MNHPHVARLAAGLLSVGILCACGGTNSALPPSGVANAPSADAAKRLRVPVGLRFKIPHKSRRGRHGEYVSLSTGSIAITVKNAAGTATLAQVTVNTHPGFSGCTAVVNGTFSCAISMTLPVGLVVFNATASDAYDGKGTLLSAIKNYATTIVLGKANQVNFTLGGVPAMIDTYFPSASPFVSGDSVAGFHIGGVGAGAAQTLQITTEDEDGNTIVGPGSPVISLQSNDTTNMSIAPVAGSNGAFTITPLHPISVAEPLSIQAAPTGNAAAPIYAQVMLSLDQVLFVANTGSPYTIAAYAPWSATPVLTIPATSGLVNPYTIAIDGAGNLYVENFSLGGSLEEFPPGSTTASRVISPLSAPAFGLAIDASGDIFVSEYIAATPDVKEFTPSGGSTPSRTLTAADSPTGINKPAGLAVDAAGNLYVANTGGTIGVSVYAPGASTTPSAVFNAGMNSPAQLAFDASGDLYVTNNKGTGATEYKPPFTNSSTVFNTFSSANTSTPFSIAVDGSANVWVGQASGGHAVEFSSAGVVMRTLSGYSNAVYSIATDGSGNAYVADNGNNLVNEYSPASGTTPIASLTTGVSAPAKVVVWP